LRAGLFGDLSQNQIVYPEASDPELVDFYADPDVGSYQDETWYGSGSSWLKVCPWGIRQAINWATREYGAPDIYITENGFSDRLGNIDDLQRIYYYKHYLNQESFFPEIIFFFTIDNINQYIF